jgi:hypothetical protein
MAMSMLRSSQDSESQVKENAHYAAIGQPIKNSDRIVPAPLVDGARAVGERRVGGRFGGAEVWVLPNPSGLNRSFSLKALTSAYRDLWAASK